MAELAAVPVRVPPAVPLAERLALAFGAGARAPALVALAEVEHEILASARPGLDHGVAHARLEWWRGEIGRLAEGAPRHPAARRLLAAAGPLSGYARLLELLAGAEMSVLGYAPAGQDELLAHLERGHGTRAALRTEILANGQPCPPEAWTRALGRGLGLARALGEQDAVILGAVEADTVRTLALEALAHARALPAEFRARQAHGLIHVHLASAALERPGGELPALRQCWLAWRTARRALGSVP
jgi:hypothetical protein